MDDGAHVGARTLVGRALRLRCPLCGGRPVFTSWANMLPNCPVCGFRFERGERGYWLGAYFANLVIMETAFVVWMGGFLIATLPDPPWGVFHLGTIVLMLLVPVAAFPFSKTLFLAFDLWIRPAGAEDFSAPSEPSRSR